MRRGAVLAGGGEAGSGARVSEGTIRAGCSSLPKPRMRPKEGFLITMEPSEVFVQPAVPMSAATPNAVTEMPATLFIPRGFPLSPNSEPPLQPIADPGADYNGSRLAI